MLVIFKKIFAVNKLQDVAVAIFSAGAGALCGHCLHVRPSRSSGTAFRAAAAHRHPARSSAQVGFGARRIHGDAHPHILPSTDCTFWKTS